MSALRILIADDHPMFRAALRHALGEISPGCVISEVANQSGLAAMLAGKEQHDLALLDLKMPGSLGFSSLVYLRGQRPALPVLVISSNESAITVSRARQFGAAGFVPKSAATEVLAEAVAALMADGTWFPPENGPVDEADAQLAARLGQLTPRQLRVLKFLAEGLLNKQIADRLSLSENTVKIHVAAILRKLGCHSRTQAAVLVKQISLEDSLGETPHEGSGRSPDLPAPRRD